MYFELQVQRCGEAEDPPDCESVRAFACTFPDALPLLQEELQPISARIGQVPPTPWHCLLGACRYARSGERALACQYLSGLAERLAA